jgi:hypothetical protein
LNTDDPVPSTNEALPNSVIYDVTNHPERLQFVPLEGDSMHSWPVAFLGKHWKTYVSRSDGRVALLRPTHDMPYQGKGTIISGEDVTV